jgi:hypothetical protein
MKKLVSFSAMALCSAGVFIVIINAIVTPFFDTHLPFEQQAASNLFLLRQGLSAITAILLLFGSIGIYLSLRNKANGYGFISFIIVSIGNMVLLAQEWGEIFIIHQLAQAVPEALVKMEAIERFNLLDLGAILAFSFFVMGWILFSIFILRSKRYRTLGPILIISGLFATPILSAVLPAIIGLIIGNALVGLGWFMLGRELFLKIRTQAIPLEINTI